MFFSPTFIYSPFLKPLLSRLFLFFFISFFFFSPCHPFARSLLGPAEKSASEDGAPAKANGSIRRFSPGCRAFDSQDQKDRTDIPKFEWRWPSNMDARLALWSACIILCALALRRPAWWGMRYPLTVSFGIFWFSYVMQTAEYWSLRKKWNERIFEIKRKKEVFHILIIWK